MAFKKATLKSRKARAKIGSVRDAARDEEESARLRPGLPFPVVAIGASAGGLAAFTELLKALPPKSGMAFVLIQHLEPKHESTLSVLLSKTTNMPVVEVADGMPVEPNRVYVIPPNKNMIIRAGMLRLSPRSAGSAIQRPIDDFSIALAEEQRQSAVGVVLSGTGSDGTYGLKAIKAAGGVTFAQDPKTAQWPAMPLSAITAGSVDFVLSPKLIAAELARVGRHPYLSEALEVPEGSDLDKVCLILRSGVGVDFRLYKQATVRRRLARRMALQKIPSLVKYAQILKQDPQEVQALADDIFINVTSFFRDPECFQALRKKVLAKLGPKRSGEEPIRIWVAGCSTGEEVYSIAILLLEELGERANRTKIQIFGTDIQERSVDQARAGIYTEAAVAGVSPARLKRFFVHTDHGYQIQKAVRDLCVFARHDLAKDPPFSRLDLISCRNVLIYMGQPLQKRILSVFQYAFNPGGFLFLGSSESIGSYPEAFTVEDQKHRIFLRKLAAAAFREIGLSPRLPHELNAAPLRTSAPDLTVDLRKETEGVLLEQYAPPALVVDRDLHILHFQGDLSRYVVPATGQPSFHLLKMVQPDLVVDLRAAINKVSKKGVTVHKEVIQFKHEGRPAPVRLEVRPLKTPNGKKQDLLVVFQRMEPAGLPADREEGLKEELKPGRALGHKTAPEKTRRIEQELASTREHLRALIAEHETTQEEMKAANEEILSSNEELQSANEELETAKEELQSANEELVTLNDELQHRNDELSGLTQDLSNLLVGVDIPVLVLDADLHVRRFTPMAGALLKLIPGDVGRPFSDIASSLDVADWDQLLSEVTGRGQLIDREVRDRNGHRYSMRVRPYKTSDNRIEGVLVVILDVDLIYRARDEAQQLRDLALRAEERSNSILKSLNAHLAVLSPDGVIVSTNDAWNRFAQDNGGTDLLALGVGAHYLQVCERAASQGSSDAQAALDGINAVLKGQRESFQFEYPCHSPTEQRWFLMNVSPLKGTAGGIVVVHSVITERKLAEIATKRDEATIRALMDSSNQSVVVVSADEKIVLVNANVEKMFGYREDELLGQPLDILIPEMLRQRHAEHHRNYFENMQSRPMGIGLDLEGHRKDGTNFPVEIGLGGIDSPAGKLAVAFVADITERRRQEQAVRSHAQEVEALAASLMTAQEDERRRVSRDLHDQICQQLASLAIDIGGLAEGSSQNTQSRLKEIMARVVKASEETRHIAYELHSSIIDDLGLVASLKDLCKQFSVQNPEVALEFIDDLPVNVPIEIASCFYRVTQQSLQNIAKHAHAKRVLVELSYRQGTLALTIADNGTGFSLKEVRGHGGLGLIGMEERVRLINGKITITARRGHGARITLQVSLPGER